MAIKDLIPWNNRGREVGLQRGTDIHPFFALHREMNRSPFASDFGRCVACATRTAPRSSPLERTSRSDPSMTSGAGCPGRLPRSVGGGRCDE
jgi:hypothetical protein